MTQSLGAPWAATVLTLYQEMFPGPLGMSLTGKALAENIWSLEAIDIRSFATNRHQSVDDTPAGGGPGMVMRADIVAAALDGVARQGRRAILLSPRGVRLTQGLARSLALEPGVILLCGRFEGVDQRVIDARALEEISIGDFVMSGGELAAMALLDSCVRLLPGVVGDHASLEDESFEHGLLEYPHYTRPQSFEGHTIPEILASGHHARIREWRRAKAEALTKTRRPDLWAAFVQSGGHSPSSSH
jgi:tRNA (guanine37-N1)-methyltransferase